MCLPGKNTFERRIVCNHGSFCYVAQESNVATAPSLIFSSALQSQFVNGGHDRIYVEEAVSEIILSRTKVTK
jgi:hypothetical protein